MRRTLVETAVVVFSALAILYAEAAWLVLLGVVGMCLVLTWSVMLGLITSLRPSRFITAQQKLVARFSKSDAAEALYTPRQSLDPAAVATWDKQQASNFVASAGTGVLAYRLAYYWAQSLDTYRKSPAATVYNGLRVLTLVVQLGLGMGFVYFGLNQLFPTQYVYDTDPTLLTFIYFAFNASLFGEIQALAPRGDLVYAFKIVNGLVGTVIVGVLITSLFLTSRSSRTDPVAAESVRRLRQRAHNLGRQVGEAYAASPHDLEQRLTSYKWALSGVVAWLVARAPADWEPDEGGG